MKTEDGLILTVDVGMSRLGKQKSEGEGEADSDKKLPDRHSEKLEQRGRKNLCQIISWRPRQAVVHVHVLVMASEYSSQRLLGTSRPASHHHRFPESVN